MVLMTELQTEMNRKCFLDKHTKKTDLFFFLPTNATCGPVLKWSNAAERTITW